MLTFHLLEKAYGVTLTERQVETLIAVVAYHRVYERPVTISALSAFLGTVTPGMINTHLCRLVGLRLVRERKRGFIPAPEGAAFALGCQFVGLRSYGRRAMEIYQ